MGTPLTITFEQACRNANVNRWIEDWDYEKNKIAPNQIHAKSNKHYWFKCHRGLHESTSISLYNITKGEFS